MTDDAIGAITTIVESFEKRVNAAERGALSSMQGTYQTIVKDLTVQLDTLANQIALRQSKGLPTPVSWLHKQQRYQSMLVEASTKFQALGSDFALELSQRQLDVIDLAFQNTTALIDAQLPGVESVIGGFNKLPNNVIQQLQGAFEPGSPLRGILDSFGDDAATDLADAITTGLAKGLHPTDIAKQATKALDIPYSRAATIARTETYRAYNEANRSTMKANTLTGDQWTWFAHLGGHTCAACLAMHGHVFSVNTPMGNHPNCRCNMLPKTNSWADLGFPELDDTANTPVIGNGEDWLKEQDEDTQLLAFGGNKRLHKGWSDGEYELPDVVRVLKTPEWGTTRTVGGTDAARQAALQRGFVPRTPVITPSTRS